MTLKARIVSLLTVGVFLASPGPMASAAGQSETGRSPVEIERATERLREAWLTSHRAEREMRARVIEATTLAEHLADGVLAKSLGGELLSQVRLQAQIGRGAPGNRGPEITETFSRRFQLGPEGTFELTNLAGTIAITGSDGNEVIIDGVKRVRNADDVQGRTQLAAIEIEYIERPGRLEVFTQFPDDRRLSGAVDFTIALPIATTVRVRTVSGDVTVSGVVGELRAESISGNVTAAGARRIDALKSVSGNVTLTDAELENSGTATTVSGNLIVSGLRGSAVEFASVSGNIRLEELQSDRLSAKAVSGNISYQGSLSRNGRYDLTTHSGRIRMILSGTTGFSVTALTFIGDVQLDFPFETVDERGRERRPGQSIRGSFGDASAGLTLRTFSGAITIEQQ